MRHLPLVHEWARSTGGGNKSICDSDTCAAGGQAANCKLLFLSVRGGRDIHATFTRSRVKIPQGFSRGEELQRGHWPPSAGVRMREEQGGVGAAPEDEGGGTAEASGAVLDSLFFFVCAHSCANTGNKCSLGSSVSVKSAISRTTSTPGMAWGPYATRQTF